MPRLNDEARVAFIKLSLNSICKKTSDIHRFVRFLLISKRFLACSRSKYYKTYSVYYSPTRTPYLKFNTYGNNKGCHFVNFDHAYILKFIQYLQPPLLRISVESPKTTDESISKCWEVLNCINTGKLWFDLDPWANTKVFKMLEKYASKIKHLRCGVRLATELVPMNLDYFSVNSVRSTDQLRKILKKHRIRHLDVDLCTEDDYADACVDYSNSSEILMNSYVKQLKFNLKFKRNADNAWCFVSNIMNHFPNLLKLDLHVAITYTNHVEILDTDFSLLISTMLNYYAEFSRLAGICDSLLCDVQFSYSAELRIQILDDIVNVKDQFVEELRKQDVFRNAEWRGDNLKVNVQQNRCFTVWISQSSVFNIEQIIV